MLVSVIIPVYNAENKILLLLNALNHQKYDGNFDIILVDDDSTDNSRGVIKAYISQNTTNFDISLVEIEHQGPAGARNIGAKKANGNILIFTDSDCVPVEGWLTAMLEPFNDPSVSGVGGTYKTENPKSLIALYIGYDIEFRHSKFEEDIDFAGSYSAGFRKEVFFKAGMFSREYKEANAEDNELSYRVIDLGEKIVYAPNAIVSHSHPDSIKKLFNQQKSRAKWRVKLFQRNKNHKIDKYTSKLTIIQPLIWIVLPLYWMIIFFLGLIFYPSITEIWSYESIFVTSGTIFVGMIIFFYISNRPLLLWIKKEKRVSRKVRILIFFIIVIRSFSWFLGGISGFINYIIFEKFKRK